MNPKDAERIANSVDPDQIGSALFAQACLSENLGSLRYMVIFVLFNLLMACMLIFCVI